LACQDIFGWFDVLPTLDCGTEGSSISCVSVTSPLATQVFEYHERTKHSFHRFAPSLGYMDWATQPDPFRSYSGTEMIPLPLSESDRKTRHLDLYERTENPVCPLSVESISTFLQLSLGLSAWKSIGGNRWPLRINPSSGNLHPTEGYLLLPSIESISGGIFHYNPYQHALERRAQLPVPLWERINMHFQADGFLMALTSIFWREAWKYGERAFRYCNHDIGHALAAIGFSANLLGWKITWLRDVSDPDLVSLLGFGSVSWTPGEAEVPDLLCFIHPSDHDVIPRGISPAILGEFRALSFTGTPNSLSGDHVDWDAISKVAVATEAREPAPEGAQRLWTPPFINRTPSPLPATRIIRQRRSLQVCDGKTSISRNAFLQILDKTLPRKGCAPFDLGLGESQVHLALFVHRVTDLAPGLYVWVRNEDHLSELRAYCRPEFLWTPVEEGLPLFLLWEADLQSHAIHVSCEQRIAGDGAFSLGMIARFRTPIEANAHMYRRLFWECGMIGQVLYLEAEAHGVRSAGIGCFFDDPVHEILGLSGNDYQSLYHFTVGGAVDDSRLETIPPYQHLR